MGGNNSQSELQLQKETKADAFAAGVLTKLGLLPVGMYITFFAWANYMPNRWDYKTEVDWEAALMNQTHPLTSDRMMALTRSFKKNVKLYPSSDRSTMDSIVLDMEKVAELLMDTEIQQSIRIKRAATTLADLQSRCNRKSAVVGDIAFQGTYIGEWLHHSREGVDRLPVTTILKRTEDQVTGTFDFGLGPGTISGLIEDNTLYFSWQWISISGRGRFETSKEGESFDGIWGYRTSDVNGGTWTGARP